MRRLAKLSVLLTVFLFSSFTSGGDISQEILNALEKGNASRLAEHFATTISITVEDQSGTYSARQGRMIIQKFFSEHPPKSFQVQGSGHVSGGGSYLLGAYTSEKGIRFSVYVLWLEEGERQKITRMTFIRN
ncbi:MAG TPA: DUF4783 domain-containing protein [Bacteroidales bacterium]|nr:DUF4783 domain-containing protein [Bacteroidales bacterium]HRZ50124.1 DUF4783 domain-containing protein [Bacteroidales bacterium]